MSVFKAFKDWQNIYHSIFGVVLAMILGSSNLHLVLQRDNWDRLRYMSVTNLWATDKTGDYPR